MPHCYMVVPHITEMLGLIDKQGLNYEQDHT